MGQLEDTICAIATPVGEGGIGIVRISGPHAIDVASKVLTLRSQKPLTKIRSHMLYLGDIHASSYYSKSLAHGVEVAPLDEVLVAVMRAPKSYTGEHVVEIHCHGGRLILSMVCESLIRHGARLADPGEFTKRAFLNGRLDLTQAEAVLDTIRATTQASLRVAQVQFRGKLSEKVEQIRNELIRLLAHLEAGMDFVEEDISFIGRDDLEQSLHTVSGEITHLVNTAKEGRLFREGVATAIIGKPNVGKSSLLNALLGMDRAIVSTTPGTTRDVLEESLNIQGVPIRLIDTAGLRETHDSLEVEGIRRTNEAIALADMVLLVVDGSQPLSAEDMNLLKQNYSTNTLVVMNKADLPGVVEESTISSIIESGPVQDNGHQLSECIVKISAKTGDGLEKLRQEFLTMMTGSYFESNESIFVTRLRHKMALERANESVMNTLAALGQQWSGECLAVDLRVALDALGEIIGVVSTDDILDHIFQEFCIGK